MYICAVRPTVKITFYFYEFKNCILCEWPRGRYRSTWQTLQHSVKQRRLRNEGQRLRKRRGKQKAKIKGRLGFRVNVAIRRCERFASTAKRGQTGKNQSGRTTDQTVQNSVML